MKKFIIIFWISFVNCTLAQAVTLYCDHEEWNHYVVLNIDYQNSIVQGPTFKGGRKFVATISTKNIIFDAETEKWKINRNTGVVIRKFMDITQKGTCSTKKPAKKF